MGEVVEVGPKVTNVQVGNRAVIDNATACGVCRNCKNGNPGARTSIVNLLLEGRTVLQNTWWYQPRVSTSSRA